jgi:hypothetical protein
MNLTASFVLTSVKATERSATTTTSTACGCKKSRCSSWREIETVLPFDDYFRSTVRTAKVFQIFNIVTPLQYETAGK